MVYDWIEKLSVMTPFGPIEQPRQTGEPFKVLSVLLPFLAIESIRGHRLTFDTRTARLVILSPEFVAHFLKAPIANDYFAEYQRIMSAYGVDYK